MPLDLQGHPLSWWLYPPYPWRGPVRRRLYGVLRFHNGVAYVTEETGEITTFPDDSTLYHNVVRFILSGNRTVYCNRLRFGSRAAGIVYRALTDMGATVLYSPRRGLMGYTFKRGKSQRGALLGMGTWGQHDEAVRDADWLTAIRTATDTLACGCYDSAGALGQATLDRFWHERGLPRVLRLCDGLTAAIMDYPVGGRAETPGLGVSVPSATEWDISSAYPTAVARGLPVGRIAYHASEPYHPLPAALFGEWEVQIHSDIPLSPVPWRDWSRDDSPLVWDLSPETGDEGRFRYNGWLFEIDALRKTGAASVRFLRGWSWPRLDSMLAPWVDQLTETRHQLEVAGQRLAAGLVKLVANAAIGRWGMEPQQYTLVPDEARDLSRGDTPLEIEEGETDDSLTGAWVRLVSTEAQKALPFHWNSYVRAAVRMELWHTIRAMQSVGYTVLASNFDAVWLAGNVPTEAFAQTTLAQESHPWVWRAKRRAHTTVIASRSFVWEDERGTQITLPGQSQAMRMAVLVDHQRRRQEAEHEARHGPREVYPPETGTMG